MRNLTKLSVKNILVGVSILALLVFLALYAISSVQAAFLPSNTTFLAKAQDGSTQTLNASGLSENLSADGTYTVSYRISSTGQAISFPLKTMIFRCPEANGHTSDDGIRQTVCEHNGITQDVQVNLNSGNNFTQDLTLSITQDNNQPCGSFQTDLFSNTPAPHPSGFFMATKLLTGKDLSSCVPQPTPTPTPSVTPSPTPTPTQAPLTSCPTGKVVKIVDSQVTCVTQEQTQTQTSTNTNTNTNQNTNTQTQTNSQTVTANGGSSSSNSSVNVTLTPAVTHAQEVKTITTVPQVVSKGETVVKELPKTGLPLAALALPALAPLGLKLRKSGKNESEASANSIWNQRQLDIN